MSDIADKRTHHLALETVRPGTKVTLKEALSAAYLQGLSDIVQLQQAKENKGEITNAG